MLSPRIDSDNDALKVLAYRMWNKRYKVFYVDFFYTRREKMNRTHHSMYIYNMYLVDLCLILVYYYCL